jgi:putative CRISPR-associated protein (TIGR02619 family)
MNYLLSPCGTSLLTNHAGENRALINKHSNAKHRENVPPEDQKTIDAILLYAKSALDQANQQEAARLSAELNGLTSYYGHAVGQHLRDHHLLLCTDTWLGEETANLVRDKLESWGFSVEIRRQTDLQTQNLQAFQLALSDLVVWCEETLIPYREKRYRIVFNLTGGFKSVQGFLQTLALFYADETIYIFETGGKLLRIPRMPVRMVEEDSIRTHLETFRRIANNLEVTELQGAPETFLLPMDGKYALNAWGELVWKQTHGQIYGEKLHPSPSRRIRYGKDFEKSVTTHAPNAERRIMVNDKIDQLARHLESSNYNPPSLDFKPLKGNPLPPATHEMDAWADQDAKRIFGHFENEVFILDKLDKALH